MKAKTVEPDEPVTTGLQRVVGAVLFVLLLAIVLG